MKPKKQIFLLILVAALSLSARNRCLADGGEVDLPDAKSTISAPTRLSRLAGLSPGGRIKIRGVVM